MFFRRGEKERASPRDPTSLGLKGETKKRMRGKKSCHYFQG